MTLTLSIRNYQMKILICPHINVKVSLIEGKKEE